MDIRKILRNIDWWLVFSVCGLMAIGLVLIYSATLSYNLQTGKAWHVQRQSMFMTVGMILVIASLFVDYRAIKQYDRYIYGFNMLLLLAVMFVGKTQLGAQRWISIGSFQFQPSEFSKVFLIICLAAFVEKRLNNLMEFKDYLPIFIYIFFPFILVMKQPDLGTSLTFIAILISVIFVAGFKYKWFAMCGAAFVAMMPLFWMVLKDYQKNRILTFLDPGRDPFGRGYHVIQSKIAIGSGGLTGHGWLNGTQSQLNFLPENHTDFIFAVAGEEFGLVGTCIIIVLYSIVIWRSVMIALNADDDFGALLATGVTGMFMFHILVNIGMTAGVMPVTGVPLPFLSYGVSSLITNLMLVALLLNIRFHQQKLQF
ncbi:MAG: rod shape-determining protein RodA [Phascolarctobacterium sp.]|nr:rod shape-determining protein RodA [Phascolarctobacterium sp.]